MNSWGCCDGSDAPQGHRHQNSGVQPHHWGERQQAWVWLGQKGWVTRLSLWFKAVAVPCLAQRGRQAVSSAVASKRCCRSGSGHILLPPLARGWSHPWGHRRWCLRATAGGVGKEQFISDPSRKRSAALQRAQPARRTAETFQGRGETASRKFVQDPVPILILVGVVPRCTAAWRVPILLTSCTERKTGLLWV